MKSTVEERREEAVKRLEYLYSNGMGFRPAVTVFKKSGKKCGIFENLGGFSRAVYYDLYLNEGQEEYNEMIQLKEEFEKEYNATVYLIQITHTEFGRAIAMLYVGEEKEYWQEDMEDLKQKYARAYVSCGGMEDIGNIGFEYDRACGGIYRTY